MLGDCGGSTSSQLSFVYEKWAEVGNFISGQIGDRFGRRTSILLAPAAYPDTGVQHVSILWQDAPRYAMIAFFGFATACSQGSGTQVNCVKLLVRPCCLRPGFMIFLRFFVGVGRPVLDRHSDAISQHGQVVESAFLLLTPSCQRPRSTLGLCMCEFIA